MLLQNKEVQTESKSRDTVPEHAWKCGVHHSDESAAPQYILLALGFELVPYSFVT